MGRLEGKVALVSGAARGMGEAEARRFAAEGARVIVGDVLEKEGRAVADELGDAAAFVALDVCSEAHWKRAVEEATRRFGGLDVLVNNAGIARTAPLVETSLADYREVIDVNQVGVFLGMREATPAMQAGGGGSIVNISSVDGIIGMGGLVGYVASKFAVRGMTKVAALELAPLGIRVNSIHPGFIDTPMQEASGVEGAAETLRKYCEQRVPLGRLGGPAEVADLALFLASDESAYMTGAELVIDGGMLAGEGLPV